MGIETGLLVISCGLLLFGLVRLMVFRLRLKKYNKVKATVTNIQIETKYFTSSGTEITREAFEQYAPNRALYKFVQYYSPEITYQADDGQAYTGTWWTEMPGKLPYNIGERIEIYYNPKNPPQFFLYDKMMMFWEPMLLIGLGLAGIFFYIFYM